MLDYLPIYYPPTRPTHQLVYVPPQPPAPNSVTSSTAGPSTPPDSPRTSHAPTPSPYRPRRQRRPDHPYPTPVTSAPPPLPPALTQPPPHLPPREFPPTPMSTATHTGPPSAPLARPPLHAYHSVPTNNPLQHHHRHPYHHRPHDDDAQPPPIMSASALSHAEILSRSKTRSRHLAADHDCVLSKYEMTMRQQPVQARMCGIGEKSDRRPVDPTPIIQLKVIDQNVDELGAEVKGESSKKAGLRRPDSGHGGMSFMQNPYYFLFACLVGGDEQEDELHVIDDGKTRFLTGTPVSSLYHLKDLDNTDAAFFVFPDLGVRKEGKYKLKLTLFEIVDQEVFYCTTMFTQTFNVYSAKKFPGMQKATELSKTFADQGLKIRVRKDPRQKRGTKAKRKSSAADSDGESADRFAKRSRLSLPPQMYEIREDARHRDYPPHPPNGYYHPASHYGGHPPANHAHGHPMPPPPMPLDPYRPPPPAGYGYPHHYPPPQPHGRPVTHPSQPHQPRFHHSLPPQTYADHPQHHSPYQPPPSAYRPTSGHYPDGRWPHERDHRVHHGPPDVPPPSNRFREDDRHREREREKDIRQPPPLKMLGSPTLTAGQPGNLPRPQASRPITPAHSQSAGASPIKPAIPHTASTIDTVSRPTPVPGSAVDGSRPSSKASSVNGKGNGHGAGSAKDDLVSPSGSSQKTNRMGLGHLLD